MKYYLNSVFFNSKAVYLISAAFLSVVGFVCAGEGVLENPSHPAEISDSNVTSAVSPVKSDSNIIKKVCALIYNGEMNEAEKLLEKTASKPHQLKEIINQYNEIEKRRNKKRQNEYQEQIDELHKFQHPEDVNDPNYVKDLNDANDIIDIFSVTAKAVEFADKEQKKDVLSNSLVKKTIKKAKQKAAQLESQGQWLDAYIDCYSWLQAIDPNNEKYSDYADELLEKANIVANFKDSPCETRKERFEGIKPEMLTRAIDVLNFNYVKTIDYHELAVNGIERCKLLAEVIKDSNIVSESIYGKEDIDFSAKFSGWISGLNSLKKNLEDSFLGVSKDKFIDTFEDILALNEKTAQIPQGVLIAQFTEAAFEKLDPYTTMVWPKKVDDFEKTMTNEFSGIGVEITKEKGQLTVSSLLPGTPAYKSGLDAGDIIVKVDEVETRDMSLNCAVKNITGPEGTDVKLTVRHPGEKDTENITITRAKITVPTIRGWKRTQQGNWKYFIDNEDKIGFIRLTSFSEKCAEEFEAVLNKLEEQGMKGLILDLRYNPGGLLEMASEISDMFLEEGLIVSTRPRFGVLTYLSAESEGTHPDYPLVILVNKYSASASEIVAGALGDKKHERAVLVGERTHGKGSVQGITHYPGNGAKLKYTMAYYHLPSGQRVESKQAVKEQGREDWGVGVDVPVELTSNEVKDMMDVRRDNDVLVKENHDNGSDPVEKHSVKKILETDPQMSIAKLIVETKIYERKLTNNN